MRAAQPAGAEVPKLYAAPAAGKQGMRGAGGGRRTTSERGASHNGTRMLSASMGRGRPAVQAGVRCQAGGARPAHERQRCAPTAVACSAGYSGRGTENCLPLTLAKGASRSHETLLTKHYCVSNKAHEEAHGFLSQYFPSDGGNRMPRTPRLPSSCQHAFETQRTLGDWRSCPPATSKQE